ncbi:hypothetical protein GEV33_005858 [Tenebrio molitor]|uniref:Peptidase C1A papain C-terminal domain-containing protein n=1 Tax=Tenebrio molitor TaxID=7067 RepID=A0A8J6HNS5_TENMO|nr:hypothetical protein GEV33_005858 [Tenebrio molitor]
MRYAFLLYALTIFSLCEVKKCLYLTKTFIDFINKNQSSWRAGKFFLENVTSRNFVHRYHRPVLNVGNEVRVKDCYLEDLHIPDSFDARKEWPHCADVIGNIRDQGSCSSCWAFSSTGVMTDRLCIQSEGEVKFQFSPQDILSCCENCSNSTYGCAVGGSSDRAWRYWTESGIVSGGDYDSYQGCVFYQESEFYLKTKSPCMKSCNNPHYKISYAEDKHFGSDYYQVKPAEKCIQAEIMSNGPVEAIFALYEDFYYYKDGVYTYTIGGLVSAHTVKIIGWGVENGNPYWLAANSWNCNWGQLKGFFKIRRGVDECGIEQYVLAGTARLKTKTSSSSPWLLVALVSAGIVIAVMAIALFVKKKSMESVINYFRLKS